MKVFLTGDTRVARSAVPVELLRQRHQVPACPRSQAARPNVRVRAALPGRRARLLPVGPGQHAARLRQPDRPARNDVLPVRAPGGHEHYFEELAALLGADGPPDEAAITGLRQRCDIEQITDLRDGRRPPDTLVPGTAR